MITYNQQQLLEVLDRFYPKQFKGISVDEMKYDMNWFSL